MPEGAPTATGRTLILTDRPSEAASLQRALKTLGPCDVASLHRAFGAVLPLSLVVCDVGFADAAAIQLLRAALAMLPQDGVAVLCLLRDPSHLTEATARSLGVTAVLPRQAPTQVLINLARSLQSRASGDEQRSDADRIRADAREAGESLATIFTAATANQPISMSALDRGGTAVLAAIRSAQVRTWLDIVWRYDDATYQHCLLVAGLAAAFARRVGLARRHQRLMAQAALIHDIGKAYIPLSILNKPGKLTEAEMTVMKTHATLGHRMLVRQGGFDPQILDIVRNHHEVLDGSGYPDGLSGEEIPSFVRMTTICDIYAALIERRPYKAPMPSMQAFSMLVAMRGKLDASLVKAFEAVAANA